MSQTSMTVAVTGGTGFVGRHVVRALVREGHHVRALTRRSTGKAGDESGVTWIEGHLFDKQSLDTLVENAQAVVHLVGIIEERRGAGQTFDRVHVQGTGNVLAAAKQAGVKRWVQMSALGSREGAPSDYHRTKWAAEELVRNSGLAWTIFRPSIIHGPDGEFMQMVRGFVKSRFNPPFLPYFGVGDWLLAQLPLAMLVKSYQPPSAVAGKLQPVWVEDVATCFAKAVTTDAAVNETIPLGGRDAITWPDLYAIAKRQLPCARKDKKIIPVPAWYAKLIAPIPSPIVPFNRDQVLMSQEDSICSTRKASETFGVDFVGFEDKLAEYAEELCGK